MSRTPYKKNTPRSESAADQLEAWIAAAEAAVDGGEATKKAFVAEAAEAAEAAKAAEAAEAAEAGGGGGG